MTWSFHRQVIIFLLVTAFFALTGFVLWFIYHPRPSCVDGLHNQDELGIDCGGLCVKVCPDEARPPIVHWQQALLLADYQYDLVALVENKNDHFAVEQMDYTFQVFGAGQVLLATVSGQTFLNPNERAVIYQPNIMLGESVPARVVLNIATTSWQRQNNPPEIHLVVSEARFVNSAPNPEARAIIKNDSLETYRDIDVQIVVSDVDRNVFAVSQTFVLSLEPNEAKDLFFSWPAPFNIASTSETIIDIYPRTNTFKPKAF